MNSLFIKFIAAALILSGCSSGQDTTRVSILSSDPAPLGAALDGTVIRFLGNGSSGSFGIAAKSLDKNVGVPTPDPTPVKRKSALALQVRQQGTWQLAGKVDFVAELSGTVGRSRFVLPDGARLDSGILLSEPIAVEFQSATAEISAALQRGYKINNTFDVVVTGGVGAQASHIYTKVRSPLLKVDGDDWVTGGVVFLRAELSAGARWPSLRAEARRSSSGYLVLYSLDYKL